MMFLFVFITQHSVHSKTSSPICNLSKDCCIETFVKSSDAFLSHYILSDSERTNGSLTLAFVQRISFSNNLDLNLDSIDWLSQ